MIQISAKALERTPSGCNDRHTLLILDDFNAITSSTEHKGSNFKYYVGNALSFSNFISGNSMIDVNYSEATFSWCNEHMAKLEDGPVSVDV